MRRGIIFAAALAAVLVGLWVAGNAQGARYRYNRYRRSNYYRGSYSGSRRRARVSTANYNAVIRQSRQLRAAQARGDAVHRRNIAAASAERARRAAAAPQVAERLVEAPPAHTKVTYGGKSYYYVDGQYYAPGYSEGNVAYEAVEPPVGLAVTSIPSGAGSVTIDGKTSYYAGGVFYNETTLDGQRAYVVSTAPGGEAAEQLAGGEPDPFKLLASMSDYIGAAASYSVKGIATKQGVLDSGQKVHFSNIRTIDVRRPDKLYSVASGDIINRTAWYDGKQISILDRERNVYAQVDAPPTIDEALDFVAREYGLTFPLSDLLYSDIYEAIAPSIESAVYIGLHKVGEIDCHHLALSGEAVDAEIWIEEGDAPLIRKVAITHREDPDALSFMATLDWDLEATFTDDDFVFTAPAGAEQIEAKPVENAQEAEETEEAPA